MLALLAFCASALMIWSMAETSRRLEVSLAAQQRIAEYASLASSLSTFGVLAYENTASATDPETRKVQLEGQVATIHAAFDRISLSLETAVGAARGDGLNEQSQTATRSLGLARMRAQFENLLTRMGDARIAAEPDMMRVTLDAFSTQFAPLLNDAIEEERRIYRDAISGIEKLRRNLTSLGILFAVIAPLLLIWFYFRQLGPLLGRLSLLGSTTQAIGRETFEVALPTSTHDEIGLLFARTNQMAARLRRRKVAVAADRADLSRLIDEKTAELRRVNQQLSEADENRRRFFADVSHELRTPLTVILAETELAESGTPEDTADALTVIRKRAAALNRRIDDLLRIARSDNGELSLQTGPVDLSEIVAQALEDTERLRQRAGIETKFTNAPAQVQADANWLRQVVASLIENAVKHGGSGKALDIRVDTDAGRGRIRIADKGPGIGAGTDTQLFKRFEQGEGAARSSGFGIGLALAKWVVEQQGGGISIESPAEKQPDAAAAPGTLVTLWFSLQAG